MILQNEFMTENLDDSIIIEMINWKTYKVEDIIKEFNKDLIKQSS